MRVCTCHKEQIIITRTYPSLIVSVVIMYKSKMNSPPPSPILNNLENGGRKQIINNKIDDVKNNNSTVSTFKTVFLYSFIFFVAMLIHDGTQEFLINRFGKTAASGKWLGFLDCLGCFIGAYFVEPINFLKDIFSNKQDSRKDFLLLTILVYGSVGAANMAITHITYPIKVIGKSCKLIPTMVVSTLMFKGKKFKLIDYVFAFSMCFGLSGFAYVTSTKTNSKTTNYQTSSLFGMLLLVFAITLDAIAPNIQERVMRKGHSPFYTMGNVNFYSSIISFSIFIISNGVSDIINSLLSQPDIFLMTIFCASSTFVGVSCYLKLVKLIGGVNTTIVSTLRKVFTIILSFLFFPKPFGIYHFIYASLVFVPLFAGAYLKDKQKKQTIQHERMRVETVVK